jgi:hypothetical protein
MINEIFAAFKIAETGTTDKTEKLKKVKQKLADIILDEKYNVPNAGKKQPTI